MPKPKPSPAKESPGEVPAFRSDRMMALGPLITPRVMELARMRLMDKNAFFKSAKLQVPDSKADVKVALLIHGEINPLAELDDEEEALLVGICSKALRERRAGELDQLRTQVQRLVFRKTS